MKEVRLYNYQQDELRYLDLLMIPTRVHAELPPAQDDDALKNDLLHNSTIHNHTVNYGSPPNIFKNLGLVDGSTKNSFKSSMPSNK